MLDSASPPSIPSPCCWSRESKLLLACGDGHARGSITESSQFLKRFGFPKTFLQNMTMLLPSQKLQRYKHNLHQTITTTNTHSYHLFSTTSSLIHSCFFHLCDKCGYSSMDHNEAYKNALLNIDPTTNVTNAENISISNEPMLSSSFPENTINLTNVAIKQSGQSSNDSDASKRKDQQENKEVSSPITKRPRKKKN